MLTPDQKAAYLADPTKCPYCGSEETANTDCDYEESGTISVDRLICHKCCKIWRVRFTLTAIEEVE